MDDVRAHLREHLLGQRVAVAVALISPWTNRTLRCPSIMSSSLRFLITYPDRVILVLTQYLWVLHCLQRGSSLREQAEHLASTGSTLTACGGVALASAPELSLRRRQRLRAWRRVAAVAVAVEFAIELAVGLLAGRLALERQHLGGHVATQPVLDVW